MGFVCIEYLRLPSGAFWLEGETYQMTRQDVRALQAEIDLSAYFDAGDEEAKRLLDEESARLDTVTPADDLKATKVNPDAVEEDEV